MKLDIGCSNKCLKGYIAWDRQDNKEAYPLELPDNSCEAVHASHILEHFSHRQTLDIIKEWVRVLQPDGIIQIAVPDFDKIISLYLDNPDSKNYPIEGYICGGHVDNNDVHMAIFTEMKLRKLMELAGLDDIEEWYATQMDCSSYPISLNLQGKKKLHKDNTETIVYDKILNFSATKVDNTTATDSTPKAVIDTTKTSESIENLPIMAGKPLEFAKVVGIWSTPRLGFLDTCDCMYNILPRFGIGAVRGTGVFWGQAITRAMENAMELDAKWLLALDYDSIFEEKDLIDMFNLINKYPGQIDALCPHQWNRQRNAPLWSPVPEEDGTLADIQLTDLYTDIYPIGTGHFGLTLIRTEAVKRMPHPWFLPVPNADGKWGEGKIDDDIYFWRKFRSFGGRILLAPDVTLGHLELDLQWPSKDMNVLHQHFLQYRSQGKPKDIFKIHPDKVDGKK